MELGMIGMGRMGAPMAQRLLHGGHRVVGFARNADALRRVAEIGAAPAASFDVLVNELKAPRAIWLMVPAGASTEENIHTLGKLLTPGDIVVDGGNAYYRDSQRRGRLLADKGIAFVDAGVSGGVWGLNQGYGLMLGGAHEQVDAILPLIRALAPAPDKGWVYCGPSGAGHFVKMVHNGIEYGLMQAYAEGFSLLAAKQDLELPLAEIAQAWCHGTVIRSWLLELTAGVLEDKASLATVAARVADSGEGRWTAQEAIDLGIPTPVISAALMARFSSQGGDDFGSRVLAMLRNCFGGHGLPRK
ncbi:MAG: phosphogluconate dehydrogenase (NAD(+)-dependent, decarboxylating) [Burkholderiales bacterium]